MEGRGLTTQIEIVVVVVVVVVVVGVGAEGGCGGRGQRRSGNRCRGWVTLGGVSTFWISKIEHFTVYIFSPGQVLTINIDVSHIDPIMVPLSLIVSKNFHSDWSVGGCRSHEQNAGCSRSI